MPDAGHSRLIERCRADGDIRDVVLTTEEEGVALAAGAWLGGERAALLMQSSGVGNCINMLSLSRTCRFPLLMFITMRGEWEEFNPWQVPMGSIVEPVLKLCEAEVYRAASPDEVEGAAERAVQHAFGDERIAAVHAVAAADRQEGVDQMSDELERRAAMATLLADRGDDLLVVPGLGSTAWDAAAAGDNDRNFYLWGAMGGAAMIGLGLALAQPDKRVAVITGDGEMLMGLGALATIGIQRPRNLAIIVFDNGVYGETGMQPSHTQSGVDLIGVARACGIGTCLDVRDEAALADLAARLKDLSETLFARVLIAADEPPRVLPERDGVALKQRFRAAIGA